MLNTSFHCCICEAQNVLSCLVWKLAFQGLYLLSGRTLLTATSGKIVIVAYRACFKNTYWNLIADFEGALVSYRLIQLANSFNCSCLYYVFEFAIEFLMLRIFTPVNCGLHFCNQIIPSRLRQGALWQLRKMWKGKGQPILKSTSWATKYSFQLANTATKMW